MLARDFLRNLLVTVVDEFMEIGSTVSTALILRRVEYMASIRDSWVISTIITHTHYNLVRLNYYWMSHKSILVLVWSKRHISNVNIFLRLLLGAVTTASRTLDNVIYPGFSLKKDSYSKLSTSDQLQLLQATQEDGIANFTFFKI